MAATPSDIARYTTDGVLVIAPVDPAVSAAIAAAHIDARNGIDDEIEMFYDVAADAQTALNEIFGYLSQVNPAYLAVELEDTLSLGTDIPLAPRIPTITVADVDAGVSLPLRVRAFSAEMGTDRYAVELMQ